jgi:hypothetical protein
LIVRRANILRWRFIGSLVLLAVVSAAEPVGAVAFCTLHPINPLCCPSPCPIADQAKLIDFVDEVADAWQQVDGCRQVADTYYQFAAAVGPNGPLATGLRRLPSSVSMVFSTYKTALPGTLTPGDLSNPRAVSEILKKSMFDQSGLNAVKLSDSLGRLGKRDNAAIGEAYVALATGLHGYARLVDVSADGGTQTVAASRAASTRVDLAANTSSRQALIDNLGGVQELLSSWAASESTASAIIHSSTLGSLPAVSASAATSPLAVSLQTKADQLGRLRQVRALVNRLDVTISAVTSLHNERCAANLMVAQYPGLRNTVNSDNLAIQFRDSDAANAAALLAQVFSDGTAAFQVVQEQLLSLDTTGWRDNATKSPAADAAAEIVVQSILSNPQRFGVVQNPQWNQDGQGINNGQLISALRTSFSSWLEDEKLERFWHPLRQDAETAIGTLDQRLGEINRRRGFDVASAAALDQESYLLRIFDQNVNQLAAAGIQSLDNGQAATIASFISAFQAAASAVERDAAASQFVTVAWP